MVTCNQNYVFAVHYNFYQVSYCQKYLVGFPYLRITQVYKC